MPAKSVNGSETTTQREKSKTPASSQKRERLEHAEENHEIGLLDIVVFDGIAKNRSIYQ